MTPEELAGEDFENEELSDEELSDEELSDEEYEFEDSEVDEEEEFDDEPTFHGEGIKGKINSFIAKIKDATQAKFKKEKANESENDTEVSEDIDEDIDSESDVGEQTMLNKVEENVKTFVNKKIPALAKILNKNKDNEAEQTQANLAQEIDTTNIDLEDSIQVPGQKKKRAVPKGVIYAVVGVGLIVFLWDDFFPSETSSDTPKVKKIAKATKKKPIVKKPVEKKIPKKEEVQDVVKEDPKPVEKENPAEPEDNIPEQPEDNIPEQPEDEPNIADEQSPIEPEIPEQPLEQPDDEAKLVDNQLPGGDGNVADQVNDELNKIDDNQKKNIDDLKNIVVEQPEEVPLEVEPSEPSEDTTENVSDNSADQQLQNLDITEEVEEVSDKLEDDSSNIAQTSDDVSSKTIIEEKPEEILPQPEIQPDISSEITKKLLSDLEVRLKEEKTVQQTLNVVKPTDPPSYEALGMGLVYNCKGHHWACIEKKEYKICRENYSWNKNEEIPLECYPVALLDNEYDCALLQQEKIDSVAETNFCSN